jgi:hypothetical protein
MLGVELAGLGGMVPGVNVMAGRRVGVVGFHLVVLVLLRC